MEEYCCVKGRCVDTSECLLCEYKYKCFENECSEQSNN